MNFIDFQICISWDGRDTASNNINSFSRISESKDARWSIEVIILLILWCSNNFVFRAFCVELGVTTSKANTLSSFYEQKFAIITAHLLSIGTLITSGCFRVFN